VGLELVLSTYVTGSNNLSCTLILMSNAVLKSWALSGGVGTRTTAPFKGEIDRENPLHRNKYLKLTVKIRDF
jgi:hypothetical protein